MLIDKVLVPATVAFFVSRVSAQIETSSSSLSSEISTNPLKSSIELGSSLSSLSSTSTSGGTTTLTATSISPSATANGLCPAANGTQYCDPGGDPYLIYCDRVYYTYALLVITNASFTECITLCSAYARANSSAPCGGVYHSDDTTQNQGNTCRLTGDVAPRMPYFQTTSVQAAVRQKPTDPSVCSSSSLVSTSTSSSMTSTLSDSSSDSTSSLSSSPIQTVAPSSSIGPTLITLTTDDGTPSSTDSPSSSITASPDSTASTNPESSSSTRSDLTSSTNEPIPTETPGSSGAVLATLTETLSSTSTAPRSSPEVMSSTEIIVTSTTDQLSTTDISSSTIAELISSAEVASFTEIGTSSTTDQSSKADISSFTTTDLVSSAESTGSTGISSSSALELPTSTESLSSTDIDPVSSSGVISSTEIPTISDTRSSTSIETSSVESTNSIISPEVTGSTELSNSSETMSSSLTEVSSSSSTELTLSTDSSIGSKDPTSSAGTINNTAPASTSPIELSSPANADPISSSEVSTTSTGLTSLANTMSSTTASPTSSTILSSSTSEDQDPSTDPLGSPSASAISTVSSEISTSLGPKSATSDVDSMTSISTSFSSGSSVMGIASSDIQGSADISSETSRLSSGISGIPSPPNAQSNSDDSEPSSQTSSDDKPRSVTSTIGMGTTPVTTPISAQSPSGSTDASKMSTFEVSTSLSLSNSLSSMETSSTRSTNVGETPERTTLSSSSTTFISESDIFKSSTDLAPSSLILSDSSVGSIGINTTPTTISSGDSSIIPTISRPDTSDSFTALLPTSPIPTEPTSGAFFSSMSTSLDDSLRTSGLDSSTPMSQMTSVSSSNADGFSSESQPVQSSTDSSSTQRSTPDAALTTSPVSDEVPITSENASQTEFISSNTAPSNLSEVLSTLGGTRATPSGLGPSTAMSSGSSVSSAFSSSAGSETSSVSPPSDMLGPLSDSSARDTRTVESSITVTPSLPSTIASVSFTNLNSDPSVSTTATAVGIGSTTAVSALNPEGTNVKINFDIQPAIDANPEQGQRLRRRQEPATNETGFLTADGKTVSTTDCQSGTTYTLNDGMLGLSDTSSFYSTDPGVASAPFATSSQPGSITTNWTIQGTNVVWVNSVFKDGVARICLRDSGLMAYFTETPPADCNTVSLSLLPAAECPTNDTDEALSRNPQSESRQVTTASFGTQDTVSMSTEILSDSSNPATLKTTILSSQSRTGQSMVSMDIASSSTSQVMTQPTTLARSTLSLPEFSQSVLRTSPVSETNTSVTPGRSETTNALPSTPTSLAVPSSISDGLVSQTLSSAPVNATTPPNASTLSSSQISGTGSVQGPRTEGISLPGASSSSIVSQFSPSNLGASQNVTPSATNPQATVDPISLNLSTLTSMPKNSEASLTSSLQQANPTFGAENPENPGLRAFPEPAKNSSMRSPESAKIPITPTSSLALTDSANGTASSSPQSTEKTNTPVSPPSTNTSSRVSQASAGSAFQASSLTRFSTPKLSSQNQRSAVFTNASRPLQSMKINGNSTLRTSVVSAKTTYPPLTEIPAATKAPSTERTTEASAHQPAPNNAPEEPQSSPLTSASSGQDFESSIRTGAALEATPAPVEAAGSTNPTIQQATSDDLPSDQVNNSPQSEDKEAAILQSAPFESSNSNNQPAAPYQPYAESAFENAQAMNPSTISPPRLSNPQNDATNECLLCSPQQIAPLTQCPPILSSINATLAAQTNITAFQDQLTTRFSTYLGEYIVSLGYGPALDEGAEGGREGKEGLKGEECEVLRRVEEEVVMDIYFTEMIVNVTYGHYQRVREVVVEECVWKQGKKRG